jgi:hypothetical protein
MQHAWAGMRLAEAAVVSSCHEVLPSRCAWAVGHWRWLERVGCIEVRLMSTV